MTLKNNLALLRKNFHVSLAKKRGLLVDAEDLPDDKMSGTDDSIQKGLDRLSFWRRLNFFSRNDNSQF